MLIAAPAALGIIIGTVNGDTRRSPFSLRTTICSSVDRRPPTPVAKMVPKRESSTSGRPACSKHSIAAASGELLDAVGAAGFLGVVEVGLRVPVGDLDGTTGTDAGPVEALPERGLAEAAGCDDAVAGDGDATTLRPQRGRSGRHQSLPTTRSYA